MGAWFPLKTLRLDDADELPVRKTLHLVSTPGVAFEIEDDELADEWHIRAVLDVKPQLTGAYASNETIPGAAATGSWVVISEFVLDVKFAEMALDTLMLVSDSALTGRVRLMHTPVGGSPVEINGSVLETQEETGERLVTGNIGDGLVVGQRYQIQAECEGGANQSDYAIVRYATLRAL